MDVIKGEVAGELEGGIEGGAMVAFDYVGRFRATPQHRTCLPDLGETEEEEVEVGVRSEGRGGLGGGDHLPTPFNRAVKSFDYCFFISGYFVVKIYNISIIRILKLVSSSRYDII